MTEDELTAAIVKVAARWFTTGGLDNKVRARQFAQEVLAETLPGMSPVSRSIPAIESRDGGR